jgi:hypothetical protein
MQVRWQAVEANHTFVSGYGQIVAAVAIWIKPNDRLLQ